MLRTAVTSTTHTCAASHARDCAIFDGTSFAADSLASTLSRGCSGSKQCLLASVHICCLCTRIRPSVRFARQILRCAHAICTFISKTCASLHVTFLLSTAVAGMSVATAVLCDTPLCFRVRKSATMSCLNCFSQVQNRAAKQRAHAIPASMQVTACRNYGFAHSDDVTSGAHYLVI